MPSVEPARNPLFDICSVMTCAISCHSVASQLNCPGGRARGESSVTTRPKQAPSAPIMPGRPSVRTAKSSCLGNISMRIGPVGVNWYCFDSVASFLARERQHVLAHHAGFVRVQTDDESPSVIVSNLSRVSSIASRLNVTTLSKGSALNAVSSGVCAPARRPCAADACRDRRARACSRIDRQRRRVRSTASSKR